MSQNNSHEHDQSGGQEGKQMTKEQMQEILPRLFLGDLKAAENIEKLRSNNISFVLSIKYVKLPCVTLEAYRKSRISHVQIQKNDDSQEDILSILEPVCDMIEGRLAKGKAVLVHCAVGKSRSATVVIAYVMRHFKMTCQQSRDFVKRKRPIICPNAAFTEQLEVWEKCRFDLQNRSIVDQGPIPDPVGLNRTTEGTKGGTEGGEEAKQEVPTIQEEAFKKEGGQEAKTINEEVVKELEERKEIADEAGKGREGQENANGDEEYKSKDKDDNVQEDDDKGDKHAEASRICEVNHPTDLSKPPKIDSGLGLDSPSSIVAKSHKPQNVDDDSTTADDIHDGIDISATGLPTPPHTPPRAPTPPPAPTPAPEIIRAAIEPLYSKYPAMGKKKLLRILNAEQGWNIGSKEFRSHLEAISGGTGTERGDDGDLISHCRVAIV